MNVDVRSSVPLYVKGCYCIEVSRGQLRTERSANNSKFTSSLFVEAVVSQREEYLRCDVNTIRFKRISRYSSNGPSSDLDESHGQFQIKVGMMS